MSRITHEHGVEIWADVLGYEGLYQVSNLGRVMRVASSKGTHIGKILAPISDGAGYLAVGLSKDGKNKAHFIHRLVLKAFKGECPADKPECCHWDNAPSNNAEWNLRWGSHRDNMNDRLESTFRKASAAALQALQRRA